VTEVFDAVVVASQSAPESNTDADDRASEPDDLLPTLELPVDADPTQQVGGVGTSGRQEPTARVCATHRRRDEQSADEGVAVAH
jgi:hypothetical protein